MTKINKYILGVVTLLLLFSYHVTAKDKTYDVSFRDADIKSALRLLAKMEKINIVIPEKLAGKVTANFENALLDDAINAILKTNGFGSVFEDQIMRIVSKEEMIALGDDMISQSYNLQFAKAPMILSQVQSLLTSRGSAIADERTNSIHVRDIRSAINNINGLLENIDRKDRQILIEAKIIDATTDFIRSLGIQWGVTKSGGNIQTTGLTPVGTDQAGRALMFNASAQGLNSGAPTAGVGLILGSFKGTLTDIQLTAAEQNGDINILSKPSVATLNNMAASIRSGEKFYVKTNGNISIGGAGTTTTNSIGSNLQEIDTGIELKVTPQISANGFIKLDINATQSEADFSRAIDGVPAVLDNSASTTVMLQDGETTIIGGLFKRKDVKSVKGIPGLMNIPLAGNLFKSRTKSKSKAELVIFITPRIIEEPVKQLDSFSEPDSILNPNPPVPVKKVRKQINRWR